jgi:hypothetical protein
VAAPLLKRRVWPALAWVAGVALLLGAWLGGSGERRSATAFVPAGPLADVPSASVRAVEVRRGEQRWRFERDGERWRGVGFDATPAQRKALDDALTLLRNAAPERRFDSADEQPDLQAAGLEPPRLSVTIDAAVPLRIDFGGANPLGVSRYARPAGQPPMLLPRYVADAWEAAAGLRERP